MKILVVDDVGYTRHYHSRLLQKLGYEVISVESGTEALQVLKRAFDVDAVLTDLMMPGMDGVEFYKSAMAIGRVSDRGQAAPPVFVLMTALRPEGNSQQKDVEKLRMAKAIGFLDVLYKPIDPAQLQSTFQNILSARGKRTVDIEDAARRLRDTIEQLIGAEDLERLESFIDILRAELQRLELAVSA